jgi:hypothetical protein
VSRLKIALPLVQTGIGVALIMHGMRDPHNWMPAQQICDAVNAPAAAVRFLIFSMLRSQPDSPGWLLLLNSNGWLSLFIETIVYFVLIWLLWYAVCVEAGGGGNSVLARKSGMRKTADVLGTISGVAVFVLAFYSHNGVFPRGFLWLVLIPWLVWGVLIAWFYLRDLRRASRG